MSGYFVEQAGACHVMLMVFETTDPDKSPPPSATRVRLVLLPGQIAGLDSEEGRSLNFACGERGTRLSAMVTRRFGMTAARAVTHFIRVRTTDKPPRFILVTLSYLVSGTCELAHD